MMAKDLFVFVEPNLDVALCRRLLEDSTDDPSGKVIPLVLKNEDVTAAFSTIDTRLKKERCDRSACRCILVGTADKTLKAALELDFEEVRQLPVDTGRSILEQLAANGRINLENPPNSAVSACEIVRRADAARMDWPAWHAAYPDAPREEFRLLKAIDIELRAQKVSVDDFDPTDSELRDIATGMQLDRAVEHVRMNPEAKKPLRRSISTHRSRGTRSRGQLLDLVVIWEGFASATVDALDLSDELPDAPDDQLPNRSALVLGICGTRYPKSLDDLKSVKLSSVRLYAAAQQLDELQEVANELGLILEPIGSRVAARLPGVRAKPPDRKAAKWPERKLADHLSAFADAAVNALLAGNRPVERMRSHFFAVFDVGAAGVAGWADLALGNGCRRATEVQTPRNSSNSEVEFFLPELRNRLYGLEDGSPLAFSSFDVPLEDAQPLSVEVNIGDYPAGHCPELAVEAVRLHFRGKICLLEWVVAGEREERLEKARQEILTSTRQEDEDGWHEPFVPKEFTETGYALWARLALGCEAPMSLAEAVDFNAEARFTHYNHDRAVVNRKGQVRSNRIWLKQGTTPVATVKYHAHEPKRDEQDRIADERNRRQIVAWLLERAFGREAGRRLLLHQLTDDRARVLTSLVLFGGAPRTEAGRGNHDIQMSRINMVDPFGTDFDYAESFCRDEIEKSCYARFANRGTWFFATEHSMSHISYQGGNRVPSEWPGNPEAPLPAASFAETYIHPDHMRGVYRRMFMHFLTLEAELRAITSELVEIEDEMQLHRSRIGQPFRNRVADLRHRLTLAASNLRQTTLSTQLQGREICEKLSERFRLEPEWDALDRKVTGLESLIEDQAERRRGLVYDVIYYLGLPVAIASSIATQRPGPEDGSDPPLAFLYDGAVWLGRLVLSPFSVAAWGEVVGLFVIVPGLAVLILLAARLFADFCLGLHADGRSRNLLRAALPRSWRR